MQNIQELLDGLSKAPQVLWAVVATIPAQRINRRRKEGYWTIGEHISHLALVQPLLLERLERFMKEERPEFVPYIPGSDEPTSDSPPIMATDAALSQFSEQRHLQIELLNRVDDAIWQKEALHPEYEQYSFYILVRHILMHDYWHMYRMEELWLTRDSYLTKLA